MKNTTKVRVPKKYENVIEEVWYEGREDGYWASLKECCICWDTECHFVHEWNVKDFLQSLKSIEIMSEEEKYVYLFGDMDLDNYKTDLATLTEKDWKNFGK